MEELTQKERDIISYLKWYSELPNIIDKAEDEGILTTEEKRRLYKLNLRKLLDIEQEEDKIELDTQLEKTRIKGSLTKSL